MPRINPVAPPFEDANSQRSYSILSCNTRPTEEKATGVTVQFVDVIPLFSLGSLICWTSNGKVWMKWLHACTT